MLRLKNTKTNEIVAVVKDVDWGSRLVDLRARIKSELKLDEDYEFIVSGTGIKKKQERKYQVLSCVTKSADESDHCLQLKFYAPVTQATGKNDKEQKSDRKDNKKGPIKLDTTPTKRYPKFYSEEEISQATESFEKERRTFFNRKLTEIIQDSSLHDWGIQEIQGVIEVHWVLKKTEILKNCVKEMISNTSCNESRSSPAEKNMRKNFDNLIKAQFMVDNEYKRLSEEVKINGEKNREKLESEFDKTFSELKIAQSTLTKSIEHYKDLQLCQSSIAAEEMMDLAAGGSDQESVMLVELSDNETDALTASVQDDFDTL